MFRPLASLYERLVSYRAFNVLFNGFWGMTAFVSQSSYIPQSFAPLSVVAGGVSIFILSFHTYYSQSYSIAKINQAEYWKSKFAKQAWLLDTIRLLVSNKTEVFRSDETLPDRLRDKSIKLILQMIYEFYRCSAMSPNPSMFRIIYQEPEETHNKALEYLKVKYWFYSDNGRPHYLGDEELEVKFFNLRTNPNHPENTNLPVKAYHSRKIEIFEKSNHIPYHYDGQETKIRSLISCPVLGKDGKTVLGVITIASNQDAFFKNDEIADHNEYLQEFVVRAAMELTAMKRST